MWSYLNTNKKRLFMKTIHEVAVRLSHSRRGNSGVNRNHERSLKTVVYDDNIYSVEELLI